MAPNIRIRRLDCSPRDRYYRSISCYDEIQVLNGRRFCVHVDEAGLETKFSFSLVEVPCQGLVYQHYTFVCSYGNTFLMGWTIFFKLGGIPPITKTQVV